MDREKLAKEIQRLQDILAGMEPDSEPYMTIARRLSEYVKTMMEYDEACDKQCERQDKLDLERERLTKEFELKVKELELKCSIETKKAEDSKVEATARRRAEKRQALWDIIKILLQIVGSAALIIVTGKTEQSVILGQHKWSLIPKVKM